MNCTPITPLFKPNDKGKYLVGTLTEDGYKILKNVLATYSKSDLKDTLIIRYDYNKDDCWSLLDQQSDDYIHSVMSGRQRQIRTTAMIRHGVSIFSFLEEGNEISKLKKRDSTLLVDINRKIFTLLFDRRSICGNSIVIMPDRNFVFVRSDSHFDVLRYSKDEIEKFLLP